MTPTTEYEPELVDALNMLVEDERASVEMEVALTSGATEYTERDALARMGIDDIRTCETLRSEMESAGLDVTPQINGVVFEVLGAERYDDRLRAFAHHQRIVAERASELLESNLDGELREALVAIMASHQRHVEWATNRASEFAATRLLEFGPRALAESAADSQSSAPRDTPATPPAEVALPDLSLEASPEEAPASAVEDMPATSAHVEPPDASETAFAESATPNPALEPANPVRKTRATTTKKATPKATTTRATKPARGSKTAKTTKPARTMEGDQPESPMPRRGRPRKIVQPAE